MHRVGPDLLEKQLPKRHEFAIFFQLSAEQETLYQKFLEVPPLNLFLFYFYKSLKLNHPDKTIAVTKFSHKEKFCTSR